MWCSIVKVSWGTDFIYDDSDVHNKIQSSLLCFNLKVTCILQQNHPEEKEYLLALRRPEVIIEKQLSSICNPMHILLQKPQIHALMTSFLCLE